MKHCISTHPTHKFGYFACLQALRKKLAPPPARAAAAAAAAASAAVGGGAGGPEGGYMDGLEFVTTDEIYKVQRLACKTRRDEFC